MSRRIVLALFAVVCAAQLVTAASTIWRHERALEYGNRAKDYLSVFPPSRERDALLALSDYVLSRDR